MPTPSNSINVATSGAVSFDGTDFTAGTLSIANGGTNASSYTQSNGIVTFNGTSLVNYAGPQISSGGLYTNSAQSLFNVYLTTDMTNATGDNFSATVIYKSGTNFFIVSASCILVILAELNPTL